MNIPLISTLLAQAQTESTAPAFVQFIPLILMVVIFYFLLIRPQMKRQKQDEAMRGSLKNGDKIVTTGGIFGSVTSVKDRSLIIKIADGVKIEILKSAVGEKLESGKETTEAETKEASK
ncbi:MAG: preprotein translocase subunit YajC [Verrucomicrobiae bacterium]|nr:preprotein translocase subunit YajC [Verrucomicrobiae bacterium]